MTLSMRQFSIRRVNQNTHRCGPDDVNVSRMEERLLVEERVRKLWLKAQSSGSRRRVSGSSKMAPATTCSFTARLSRGCRTKNCGKETRSLTTSARDRRAPVRRMCGRSDRPRFSRSVPSQNEEHRGHHGSRCFFATFIDCEPSNLTRAMIGGTNVLQEAPAIDTTSHTRTLPGLRRSQLLARRRPSPVRSATGRREAPRAHQEGQQSEENNRVATARQRVAETLPKVPRSETCPQTRLRLWSHIRRPSPPPTVEGDAS